jgi:hypothetical protein
MLRTTYRRHLPALVIMVISIGLWLALLPFLPNPITVNYPFPDNPSSATEPMVFLIAMCGFMLVAHVVIVLMDVILFARVVPGYIMAVVDWIVEGFTADFYLSILAAAANVLPFAVGLVGGYLAMIVILGILYRKSKESVEAKAGPLFDSPYFERVRPSLMARIVFIMATLSPSYIIIVPAGIRIIGVLYDVTYPWERIAEVKKGEFFTFFSNRPVKLNQTLTNTVEIRLKDRRGYPLISAGDRGRFLKTAAQFMAGR